MKWVDQGGVKGASTLVTTENVDAVSGLVAGVARAALVNIAASFRTLAIALEALRTLTSELVHSDFGTCRTWITWVGLASSTHRVCQTLETTFSILAELRVP